jgi:hypothetical protein
VQPKVGDRVGLDAKKVGQPIRVGVVERVAEGLSGSRYEIRWEDGSASIIAPSAGTLQILTKTKGKAKAQVKKPKAPAKARTKKSKRRS